MQESSIGAHKREVANVDSEEDDEADDQLEIIDENTIGEGEDDPMIGMIVNESSEDAHGEKGGDRFADKDDLEETLHDWESRCANGPFEMACRDSIEPQKEAGNYDLMYFVSLNAWEQRTFCSQAIVKILVLK